MGTLVIILLKLLVFELFVWANAIYDAMRISNGEPIHHKLEVLFRGTVLIMISLVFNWSWDFWKELLFFLFMFWQFDYVLNYVRGKKWWYLGNAWWDKILKGCNLRYLRLGMKVILVLGSILILACSCSSSSKMIQTKYGYIHKYQLERIEEVRRYNP